MAIVKNAEILRDPLSRSFRMLNASIAAQTLTAGAANYIIGSELRIPRSRVLSRRAMIRWRFSVTKTAAGIATSTYDVRVGTTASTADTARLSFTKPAGTAAADEGLVEILATVREGGATGVLVGQFVLQHNLASTGHAQVPVVVVNDVSSVFDMTPENLAVGLTVTPGEDDALTIELVQVEALNLAPAA